MDRMAELAYIPIYDLNQPEAGVVACLEVAISASAKEALVANIISEAAELLGRLDVRSVLRCLATVLAASAGSNHVFIMLVT